MKVTSGEESTNNHVQVNHCVVDGLMCPLLCASRNREPHREAQSARGSGSVCTVYIPIQQLLSGLHVLPGSIPYFPGTKIANGPKWPLGVKRMFLQQIMIPCTQKHFVFASRLALGPSAQTEVGRGRGGGVPATTFPGTRECARVVLCLQVFVRDTGFPH